MLNGLGDSRLDFSIKISAFELELKQYMFSYNQIKFFHRLPFRLSTSFLGSRERESIVLFESLGNRSLVLIHTQSDFFFSLMTCIVVPFSLKHSDRLGSDSRYRYCYQHNEISPQILIFPRTHLKETWLPKR